MIEKMKIKVRTTEMNGVVNNRYWETPLVVESSLSGLNNEVVISLPEGATSVTVLAIDLIRAAKKASELKEFLEENGH